MTVDKHLNASFVIRLLHLNFLQPKAKSESINEAKNPKSSKT